MEQEEFLKLKKGNARVFQGLYEQEMRRAWFVCCHMTLDVKRAATLFTEGWKGALTSVRAMKSAPKESFRTLFYREVFRLSMEKLEEEERAEGMSLPSLSEKYQYFVEEMDALPARQRRLYLLHTFGALDTQTLADMSEESFADMKSHLTELSSRVQDVAEKQKKDPMDVLLWASEFKNSDGKIFASLPIPSFLLDTLDHDFELLTGGRVKQTEEVQKPMKERRKKQHAYGKWIAVCLVIGLVVSAAAIWGPSLTAGSAQSSSTTTYNVEEVTTGSVSTTISGSGSLSPVTSDTLSASGAGTVKSVNYAAGDTVSEGDVIAVITYQVSEEETSEEEVLAPYDGVLLEMPIGEGDAVEAGAELALLMGLDGFSMGIAVDELNISQVAIGQDVEITIDAVEGDYTGEVASISYNGTTSGSVTAYQITAAVEYVEGVYPGMSVSAQIVIEDSGEGLIVPVDAVQTSGDTQYVYLAPSDAQSGGSYDEDEISLSDLTRVEVESGMSDGSYIRIDSEELSEGALIIVPQVTSTQTGSSDTQSGFMGGGMNFGDFDFSNFDPSQMPQGMDMPFMGS